MLAPRPGHPAILAAALRRCRSSTSETPLTIAPCHTAGRSPVLHSVVFLRPTLCLKSNTLFQPGLQHPFALCSCASANRLSMKFMT
eukprot:4181987-Pyramimonas_sp.AAC.1